MDGWKEGKIEGKKKRRKKRNPEKLVSSVG